MKLNIVITLPIILSLFTIIGCSDETDEYKHNHENPKIQKSYEESQEVSCQSGFRFGFANSDAHADIKSELIDYITEFNNLTSFDVAEKAVDIQEYDFEEFYNHAYIDNNISAIESFYFPNITIDGYKLYRAIIDEWSFLYYYAPVEKLNTDEEYVFEFNDGILLSIDRPHWIDASDPLGSEINKMNTQNREYILQNNLLYKPDANSVLGVLGETRFSLIVPDVLNDSDNLLSLGEEIIQSSELVYMD